jgi:hypothetical protein
MFDYELFFEEIRYYDISKTWQTGVPKSVLIENMKDDTEAIFAAKVLIHNTSDDPLVVQRIPIKLVRIIQVDSWK